MSKIITTNDLNSTKFYQLPKAFFHNPLYISMKNESKIAYAILRDLLELSIKNNWINDQNEVYVKLSREKLMKYLNIRGTQKMTQIMNELKENKLIVERQLGLNKCNEIYICIPEELDIIYNDEELLEKTISETTENTKTFENQKSGVLKIKSPEIRKSKVQTFENQRHTNTNITNTNLTNTNITTTTNKTSSCSNTYDKKLINEFEENICTLKKTTSTKFKEYIEKYEQDFILAVIEYCAEISIHSFAGFKKVINSYIEKGIVTKDEFILSVETYRANKRAEHTKTTPNKNYNNKNKTVDRFNDYEQREYTQEQWRDIENSLSGTNTDTDIDGESLLKKILENKKQK